LSGNRLASLPASFANLVVEERDIHLDDNCISTCTVSAVRAMCQMHGGVVHLYRNPVCLLPVEERDLLLDSLVVIHFAELEDEVVEEVEEEELEPVEAEKREEEREEGESSAGGEYERERLWLLRQRYHRR